MSGIILAIDPGPTESAVVVLDGTAIEHHAKLPNAAVLAELRRDAWGAQVFACERIMGTYGKSAGIELMETVEWCGRFREAWERTGASPVIRVPRKTAVSHVTDNPKAGDSHVRQALIDLWGGDTVARAKRIRCEACKGKGSRKGQPCFDCRCSGKVGADGPLLAIVGDEWSALAVAVTVRDGGLG